MTKRRQQRFESGAGSAGAGAAALVDPRAPSSRISMSGRRRSFGRVSMGGAPDENAAPTVNEHALTDMYSQVIKLSAENVRVGSHGADDGMLMCDLLTAEDQHEELVGSGPDRPHGPPRGRQEGWVSPRLEGDRSRFPTAPALPPRPPVPAKMWWTPTSSARLARWTRASRSTRAVWTTRTRAPTACWKI